MIDWTITPASIWLLIGAVLILSEFVLPGIIALFFGLAAILVALLLGLGLDLSLNAQIMLFAILGGALLLVARRRIRQWFVGVSTTSTQGVEVLPDGERATAIGDFRDGRGLVLYRGAQWEAESEEPVAAGDVVWTHGRRGLVLLVGTQKPEQNR